MRVRTGGLPQFHLRFSLFLIAATFLVSVLQAVLTLRMRNDFIGA